MTEYNTFCHVFLFLHEKLWCIPYRRNEKREKTSEEFMKNVVDNAAVT